MRVGKYELVRKIASGGMAEVYLAKAAGPMGFEKTLVLKRILPHLAEDPAFVEMFLGEARLAAQLEHPNVVQIFDFGEADGSYFLAMELIDGPTLRRLVKRAAEQALPPVMCAKLVALAAEGLAFAHDFCDPVTGEPLGLIHRDVSPDNILVSRQGAVKVVDFGVAKVAGQGHRTQTGVMKGKVAYMPPEQLRTLPLDRRVDVYALGVVLYELLTGKRPFDATTEASTMQAILFEPFTPVVERRADVPVALQEILQRALAKERDERYPDCRAFQADLERYLMSAGEPVGAYQIAQFVGRLVAEGVGGVVVGSPAHGVLGPGSKPGSAPRSMAVPVESKPLVAESLSMDETLPTTPAPQLARMVLTGGEVPPAGEGAEGREHATRPVGSRRKTGSRPMLPAHEGVVPEVRGTREGWSASGVPGAPPVESRRGEASRARREEPDEEVADEDHISTGAQARPQLGSRVPGVVVAALVAGGIVGIGGLGWFALRGTQPIPVNPPPLPSSAKAGAGGQAPSEVRGPVVAKVPEKVPASPQAQVAGQGSPEKSEVAQVVGQGSVPGHTEKSEVAPAVGKVGSPAVVQAAGSDGVQAVGSGAEVAPTPVQATAPQGGKTDVQAAAPVQSQTGGAGGVAPAEKGPAQVEQPVASPGAATPVGAKKVASGVKTPATAPRATRASTRKAKAKLEFRVRPYADIYIGGKFIGGTPIEQDVEVDEGTVLITFKNAELNLTKVKEYPVKAGKPNLIKFNFYEE
ncbi:Serine/threonine-protein kinase pkn6 [Myxococcus stipitatus]